MKTLNLVALATTTIAVSIATAATPQSASRAINFVDSDGKKVGIAAITETKHGIKIALDLKTTGPGVHAMHIHQNGKCEGPDFKTAGDHFNPTGKEHGHANPKGSHAGDLPNIRAAKDGAIRQDIEAHGVSLKTGDATTLATSTGTSLIIHAKPDDGKTNPSGNSGDRIYCAVLTEPKTAIK